MPIRRIVLMILVLFLGASISFAYTVILKNGKRVDGVFLEEDDSTIVVKDKDGIILTFKKSSLDLQKMSAVNEAEVEKDTKQIPETERKDNQKPQKPAKRVFTNEDLKDLPEISTFSPESVPEISEEEPPQPDDTSLEAEEYWKEQTRKFAEGINGAKDDYEELKRQCEEAEQTLAWYVLNGYVGNLWIGQDVARICDQANQAKAEVERWGKRLEQFQEQARREGALPGWIDPDRID